MPRTPMAESTGLPLLEVEDLRTHFVTEEGELRAVDGVSFELAQGRTLAVVGESGCGKSVTAHSLLRLISRPGRIVGGAVRLHSAEGGAVELLGLKEGSDELQSVRGGRVAMVFQESGAALSPVHTIGSQIVEAIRIHRKVSRSSARRLALEALDRVGIADAKLCYRQYSHQLSGGMRQRALIAMALVTEPELLIADEPTTALDVTIQEQVLRVFKELQRERQTSILLITHDLSVVSQMADEVLVMYLGRVVEKAPVEELLSKPRHPYTQGLLASLPSLTPVGEPLPSVKGSVPALSQVPAGCAFHPRCEHAESGLCDVGEPPALTSLASQKARSVACHRVREVALSQLLQQPNPPARVVQREEVSQEAVFQEEVPSSRPVSVAAGRVTSTALRPEFMSSVRPSAIAAPVSRSPDELEVEVAREETLPLPSSLLVSSEPPGELEPAPGTEPPPHTERPEPFARASQPPPAHTERPEPFSRASQPPDAPSLSDPTFPGPARLPRSLSVGALSDLMGGRGSEPPPVLRSDLPPSPAGEKLEKEK